jgi:glutaredoxin-dependent peroxiredoxin
MAAEELIGPTYYVSGRRGLKRKTRPTTVATRRLTVAGRVLFFGPGVQYEALLKETLMSVDVGAKAPDFTLPNQDREPVTLSDQLKNGPVVLAFFPAAYSGTCQKEMCTFRDSASALNKVNAKVLGISVDTFFALKAWGDENKLNFPLLSDFNKDVIAKYGVVNPDMIGLKNIAKRSVFVIDRGGVVRHREVLDDARNEPNYDKISQTLATM